MILSRLRFPGPCRPPIGSIGATEALARRSGKGPAPTCRWPPGRRANGCARPARAAAVPGRPLVAGQGTFVSAPPRGQENGLTTSVMVVRNCAGTEKRTTRKRSHTASAKVEFVKDNEGRGTVRTELVTAFRCKPYWIVHPFSGPARPFCPGRPLSLLPARRSSGTTVVPAFLLEPLSK